MPRPERPLDADNGPVAEFAAELRLLREKAGSPPYRELARRAHYSVTTLSEAAGGKRLPTLAVTLAYVSACGGNRDDWEQRWQEATAQLAAREAPTGSTNGGESDLECPYVGLAAFGPEDADRFFGRESLTYDLVSRVSRRRFLAVFGASGAGKSSLLRAGLLPRIRSRGEMAVLFTPGPHPLEECAAQLAGLTGGSAHRLHREIRDDARGLHLAALQAVAGAPPDGDLVVVVDQFEEIFTLCQDREERTAFLTALLTAARADNSRTRIVLGVRADFFARCAEHPELVEALRDAQLLVGPMSTEELRRAITQPAARVGHAVEGALLAQITAEATGQPGILPLVSHTMRETWRRRHGNTLTLVGYQAAGGIRDALARTAEELYTGLTEQQQARAAQIFVRLVALGEGTEDTKRRIARHELDTDDPDTDVVLDSLARTRLLTLDDGTVEITHEALIRCWPRLRRWLDEDRAGLRTHRELTEATAAWEALNHDPSALYRGTRLAVVREWANRGRTALTPRESAFLAASVRDEERAHRSVRRRNRQLYWLSVGLTVLLLLVSGIATGGELQRRNTTARMLAAEAEAVAATDTGTAIRRSLEAYHAYDTPETRSTVLSLAGHPNNHGELRQSGTSALAFSPDGAVLATGGQGELALWSHRTRIAELGSPQETAAYSALGFAPDGKRLAAGRENGQIEVWDTTGRVRIAATSGTGARITDVEFTGQILAVARGTTVELWDTALRQRTGELPGGFGTVWELALSPDGRTLALATDNGIVLWDLGTNTRLPELPQPRGPVNEVAFSPDGSRIAAARPDLSLSMWELTGSRRTTGFPGVTVPVSGLAFAPDGRTLLSASFDNTVTLWDGDRPGQRRTLLATEPGGLTDIAASRDGSIAAMSRDAILRWEMARLPLAAPESSAPITYTPDGSALVGAADGTLVEWRGNGAAGGVPLGRAVNAVFSRDRTKLALNSGNTVSVWDVVRRTKEAEWAVPEAHAIALSADGAQLAVADTEGTRIWNVAQRRPVTSLKGYPGRPSALDLSPDGRRLAAGGEGDVLMVWDVASGQRVAEEADTWGLPTFAPDGKHLAVFGYSGATLWDPENSSRGISGFTRLGRGMLADSSPATTAFSPDGRFLAAAGENNTVVLFDVVNGGPWATLTGHTGPVHSLAWNHDGSRLATAGGDGTIIEWSTAPDQAISQLCQMLAEDFPNHDQPRVTTCTR